MPVTREAQRAASGEKKRQTQEDRSAATREKLIDGAYNVLLELGHAGLRSANISTAAGVSRGGLLHHYPTKEMLIAAVYERIVDRMEASSRARIAAAPDDEVLEALVADAYDRFFGDAYRVMLDILVGSGEEEPVATVHRKLGQRDGMTADLGWAERLASTGVPSEPAKTVASFLWSLVKGLAVRDFVRHDEEHDRKAIALGIEIARKQIAGAG